MKVLLLSKACVVGAYQRKLEEIAARGVALTVVVPPAWKDPSGTRTLEKKYTRGYRLLVSPMRFNGHFHIHFYPELARILRELRPDIVHVDEEPWDLVTFHAVRHALQVGARPLFFTWQNLRRRYPFPFSYFQRFTFHHCAHAIAGNADAVNVLRAKGYRGVVRVIPQFGVDPEIFQPPPNLPRFAGAEARPPSRSHTSTGEGWGGGSFTVGYAGRFTREKGIDTLLRAVAQLGDADWQLRLAGSGPALAHLQRLAHELTIAERVHFETQIASTQMPDFYRALDVFVLPSRRAHNWVEQFGRVLIEAMACGVPVIGSDTGEIPNTIGDAGLIFHEDDVSGLQACLVQLMRDESLRCALAERGRTRVLQNFTQASIAEQTVGVYQQMV